MSPSASRSLAFTAAVTALLSRPVLARRLYPAAVDLTQSLAQLHAGEKMLASPVSASIELAWERACVSAVAVRHDETTRPLWEAPNANITEALEALWAAEDAVTAKSTWGTRKTRREAEVAVRRGGLDLKVAQDNCKGQKTKPFQAQIEACVASVARDAKTRSGRNGKKEKALKEAEDDLPALLHERFELEWDLEFLGPLSSRTLRWTKAVRSAQREKKRQLKVAEKSIKKSGFLVKQTWTYCEKLTEEDGPTPQDALLNRVTGELSSGAAEQDHRCQEILGHVCPEGTSPQNVREYDAERAAKATAASFFVWKPVGLPLAGAIGFLAAGSVGAAQAMVFFAFPGWTVLGTSLIGAIAGLPWRPDCTCASDPCAYDEKSNSCKLVTSNTSTNEFQWLPYPGSKCAAVPSARQPRCELQPCSAAELEPKAPGDMNLFGTLGEVEGSGGEVGGVHNCLSTDGTLKGMLAMATTLPGPGAPNTAANREELYKTLLASSGKEGGA